MAGSNFDGYLLFGSGILDNPYETSNYINSFSVKINLAGDLMWSNRFDEDDTLANFISANNLGSLFINHKGIITGPFTNFINQSESFRSYRNIAQFDDSGQLIAKIFVDSTYDDVRYFSGIEDFYDSTYIFIGGRVDSLFILEGGDPDALVSKIDTLGNFIWQKSYPATFSAGDIVPSQNGGYWLFATEKLGNCSIHSDFDYDIQVIRIGEDGNELARWIINQFCGGEGVQLFELDNGQLLLVGKISEEEEVPSNLYSGYFFSTVLEYSNNEIVEVTDRINYHHDSISSYIIDLKRLSDNSGYVSAGWIWDPEWAQYLGYIMKIDNDRQLVWKRTYNYFPLVENVFNGWNYLYQVSETSDGGFIGVGQIREHAVHPNPQLYVPWVFKTDEYGCLEPGCQFVGTEDILVGLENTMTVFPNPVGDIATISFGKENLSQISELLSNGELVIFDINGKEIYRTNTRSVTTEGQLQINTQSWPSGIYLAQLISGSKWLDGVRIVRE
jgi:hypothetical protein